MSISKQKVTAILAAIACITAVLLLISWSNSEQSTKSEIINSSTAQDPVNTAASSDSSFTADGFVKITNGEGGLDVELGSGDRFSRDHDQAGDINGDGTIDLIVGARSDDDGGEDVGAAYVLFMNSDGTVKSSQKISMLEGGFSEVLPPGSFFGYGVAGIGDYNDDGVPDVAVSAPANNTRSIYILHLNTDGTVKDFVKNSNITAQGLSAVGDLNGDGRVDLTASDPGSDVGGTNAGAIRILFFDDNSKIKTDKTALIDSESGGFSEGLEAGDQFGGRETASLGDLDGDGTTELAVGAFQSNGGKGAIWILSLEPETYTVVSKLEIAEGLNGFNDSIASSANNNGTSGGHFGHALAKAGDLDGDGVEDLFTGANQQDDGVGYILYLNADKTVKDYSRIDSDSGGFDLELERIERFSRSISYLGDLRGDGSIAINVGGGAGGTGTLYILFFKTE